MSAKGFAPVASAIEEDGRDEQESEGEEQEEPEEQEEDEEPEVDKELGDDGERDEDGKNKRQQEEEPKPTCRRSQRIRVMVAQRAQFRHDMMRRRQQQRTMATDAIESGSRTSNSGGSSSSGSDSSSSRSSGGGSGSDSSSGDGDSSSSGGGSGGGNSNSNTDTDTNNTNSASQPAVDLPSLSECFGLCAGGVNPPIALHRHPQVCLPRSFFLLPASPQSAREVSDSTFCCF